MQFEWDPAKADSNLEKHGIDFDDAVRVFKDSRATTIDVTKPEYGENRFKTVRMVDGQIVAVVFTDRGHLRRIISARRSRNNERREDIRASTTSR